MDLWVPLAPLANWYLPADRMMPVGNAVGALFTLDATAIGAGPSEAPPKYVNLAVQRTAAATARPGARQDLHTAQNLARTRDYVQLPLGPGEDTGYTKIPKGFAGIRLENPSSTNYAIVRLRVWAAVQVAA